MKLGLFMVLTLSLVGQFAVWADSGRPVGKKVYWSSNRELQLTADPGWLSGASQMNPVITLSTASGTVVWSRGPEDFEAFTYPMHVSIADEGLFLVFGGYSMHNISSDTGYDEGLRFYEQSGALIRFVSRLDLPPGQYSVSTAHWYDSERTRIDGGTLLFFRPGTTEPMEFELSSGRLLQGTLTPGQGDDEHWREKFLQRSGKRDGGHHIAEPGPPLF